MENSLHETKEIQWDWDEDDEGVVAEQVVIDGKKYIDIDYFNQKMYDHEQRFQDQSDLIEKLKSENHALISDNAYQEADLFEFNSRIEQLQKKLAEKEERINWLVEAEFNRKWAKKYVEMRRKEEPMLCLPDSDEVYQRYFELKQQLAEKEKEIAEYKRVCTIAHVEDLQIENMLLKGKDQDKISFAVEQLEKVRYEVPMLAGLTQGETFFVNYKQLCRYIQDQIKQLKTDKNV